MRLDLYLKKVHIFKSRTQAHDACKKGRVSLNGKLAKGSQEIQPGDIVEIDFPGLYLKISVLEIPKGNVSKKDREKFYSVIDKRKKDILEEKSEFIEWLMSDEFE